MGTWNISVKGVLGSLAALLLCSIAQAEGSAATREEDKVDITDLENKYWAPKDTDFSVVQNRTYSKEHRFFLTPQWGKPINDPYSDGSLLGATINYFWSERMGVQLMGFSAAMSDNEPSRDIQALGSGAIPNHGKLSSYYGLGFNLVPFYAKMSFWGKKIIYFDMAFTPTLGMTTYDQVIATGNREKSALTFGLDITQFFFFTNFFAIRADLKNQFHSEEVVRARGNGTSSFTGEKLKEKTTHETLFLIGVSFFY